MYRVALGVATAFVLCSGASAAVFDDFEQWTVPATYSPTEPMPSPWYVTSGQVGVTWAGMPNTVAHLFGDYAGMGYAFSSPLTQANTGALTISIELYPGIEVYPNGPNFARLASINLTGPDTTPGVGPAYMPVDFRIADGDDPASESLANDSERTITDSFGNVRGYHYWGVPQTVTFSLDADWSELTRTVSWNGTTLASWSERVQEGFTVTGLYLGGASTQDVVHPAFNDFYASVPEPTVIGGALAASWGLLIRRRMSARGGNR